jgi:transmembrane sensor
LTKEASHSDGPSPSTLEAEAARWAAALDAKADETPEGLDAWLAQNPRHAGALLRAQATLALFTPPLQLVPEAEPETPPPDLNAPSAG